MPAKKIDPAPVAEGKNPIQVIDRMMKLLDVLAQHPDPVTLKQLALETGLHPSTAHRILGAHGVDSASLDGGMSTLRAARPDVDLVVESPQAVTP